MLRLPDPEPRAALLAAVMATLADRGLGGRSLRDIAAAAGTSHRMLIHHFGSREGLLVAVVEEIESRQRTALAALHGRPADRVPDAWSRLGVPSLRPFERLFFESYSRGVNGEAPFDRLIPGAVDSWLATTSGGQDRDPALRRLGLAVVRGLLLDLVATGDEEATTAALDRFVQLLRAAEASPRTGERREARRRSTAQPAH